MTMIANWLAVNTIEPKWYVIAEERRPEDGEENVLDDQADGNRHDDHREQPCTSAHELEIHVAVQYHREDRTEDGGDCKADPDVHPGVVREVSGERTGRHDVAVRKIQDVGHAELERETNGGDRQDRRRDQPEANRRNQLLHEDLRTTAWASFVRTW
jgi:hypothetical protein